MKAKHLGALVLLLSSCITIPKITGNRQDIKEILYPMEGVKVVHYDTNRNGIVDATDYYRMVKNVYELRYTMYDFDEDGRPDILMYPGATKNKGYIIFKNEYKE